MDVQMQGTNVELTDELRAFVEDKMDDAYRMLGAMNRDPVHVDLELEKTTRRHPHELEDQRRYRAEANLTVPGRLIRAEGSADDVRQAVVEMKHRLMREIREWREHLIDDRRKGARRAKREMGAEIEAERYAGGEAELDEEERYAEEADEFGAREEENEAERERGAE